MGVRKTGYNVRMKKVFGKNSITQFEMKAVKRWTEDSSEIKKCMWGISNNEDAKRDACILFSLFEKYESNIEDGIALYRGMSIPKEVFIAMGYDTLVKGSSYTPDDKAISSFTKSKRIAYDFAADGEFEDKVIIKVLSHKENMLDISSMSTVAQEEETILTKNMWYNVKQIKKIKRGDERWLLMALEKE
jgi:hypothetical protein